MAVVAGKPGEQRNQRKRPVQISGVSAAMERFSLLVAGATGLSPAVVAAWTLAEGGPSYNPLNIGPGYTYPSLEAGAKATADLINSAQYKGIQAAAGGSDQQQINAIVASTWCPGCAGYQQLLEGTYGRVSATGGSLPSAGGLPAPGTKITGQVATDGGLIGDDERKGALRALLYVAFALTGAGLAAGGFSRMTGLGKVAMTAAALTPQGRVAKAAKAVAK